MTPAALSVARTRTGLNGASRRRTPVASKNAFATAGPGGTCDGSPEPVVAQFAFAAAVFTSLTTVPPPGLFTTKPFGPTIATVTSGASLMRRIGYETQSVLVTRS